MLRVLLVLLVVVAAQGTGLRTKVQRLLASSKEARASFQGIYAVDLSSGQVLIDINARKLFVPASNTKLFTTALAFERLGPDYRFRTRVVADSKPGADGRVNELRIVGGGDPNLSARVLPYDRADSGTNPLAAIEQLADQVVAAGVREVNGDIVGDDTAYMYEPYPGGWSADDPVWEYGAPVSALAVNDNSFRLRLEPGEREGLPAQITVTPAIEGLIVHNRTSTGTPSRVEVERLPGSPELVVSGIVGEGRTELLAVPDAGLWAAQVLRDALSERGVVVRGGLRARHRTSPEQQFSPGVELACHQSAPLSQALQVINKVSQNLHTEMVLREIARQKHGVGSRKKGLEEIDAFLKQLGVSEDAYNFEDGSGLSRLTLVTPATIMAVLRHMYHSPHRELWMNTMPVGGVDGTLEKRFERLRRGDRILAKTGSISHVSGLSGYVKAKSGGIVAFAILANNYDAPHKTMRALIDRIALAIGGY